MKTVGTKLRNAQAALLDEIAAKNGMTPSQYMREVVLREHVERLGYKWPESYIEDTGHGGRRRGAGRKAKIKEL